MEVNEANKYTPVAGANVYWLNATVGTVTDFDGKLTIPYKREYEKLVVSFVGYKTDTLTVKNIDHIHHLLKPTSSLDEVVVTSRK